MDLSELVDPGDGALPKLSTATMTAEGGALRVPVTQSGLVKFGVSGVLSVLGMYYLATGKKESDVQKMLIGGALSLLALFMF